jgi:hypothetical protein
MVSILSIPTRMSSEGRLHKKIYGSTAEDTGKGRWCRQWLLS